jgi:hypothetical protein
VERIRSHEVFVNIMRDCEGFNNHADILGWYVAPAYIVACKSHSSKELKSTYDYFCFIYKTWVIGCIMHHWWKCITNLMSD